MATLKTLSLLVAIALTACGGGSTSSTGLTSTDPSTGGSATVTSTVAGQSSVSVAGQSSVSTTGGSSSIPATTSKECDLNVAVPSGCASITCDNGQWVCVPLTGTGGGSSIQETGGSSSTQATGGKSSTGGSSANNTGGSAPTTTGGKTSTTGGAGTGGKVPTTGGSAPTTGGKASTGGTTTSPSTGGSSPSTGGQAPTGGASSTCDDGTPPMGITCAQIVAIGGCNVNATYCALSCGFCGGSGTGGSAGTGGASHTGGNANTGGTSSTAPTCGVPNTGTVLTSVNFCCPMPPASRIGSYGTCSNNGSCSTGQDDSTGTATYICCPSGQHAFESGIGQNCTAS